MFRGLGRFGFPFFEVVDVVPIRLEDLVPIEVGDEFFGELIDIHLLAVADSGVERLGLGRLEFFEDVVGVDVLVVRIFRKGAGVCRRVPAVKQVTAAWPGRLTQKCRTKY